MKNRIIDTIFSRVVGTAFLLAGMFFVGFTILSMRSVFADPIAGYDLNAAPVSTASAAQSARAAAARANPRAAQSAPAAPVTGRGDANNQPSAATVARGVSATGRVAPATTSAAAARGVTARPTNANVARTATASPSRAVVARVGMVGNVGAAGRVSVQYNTGPAQLSRVTYLGASISRAGAAVSSIVDPTTGLISADAYSNCLESYYTCMDEICTARNPAQRRCACAARVKTFSTVEAQLQTAKEDLLKVAGEISLMVASGGKSINQAFQLTDAEKTLNCVSRLNAEQQNTVAQWCIDHLMLDGKGVDKDGKWTADPNCVKNAPDYCASEKADGIGLNAQWRDTLNGASSDILSALNTYLSTIQKVNVITVDNPQNLFAGFNNVQNIVFSVSGLNQGQNNPNPMNIFTAASGQTTVDTLAATWGYNLFQYAHNNVCNRVLDSCFNGIFEGCKNKAPFNYNSKISISDDGNELTFLSPGTTTVSDAACYGYTSTNDPYYETGLRTRVADARRSILQKYVLDANADCDTYGEQLKQQATNMAYQKIAATQLLQQKRLEFAQADAKKLASDLSTAKNNFNQCVSDIYDCYEQQYQNNPNWTTSHIVSYCAQVASISVCYEVMVCDRDAVSVVDIADKANCNNSTDPAVNDCRNVVTLSEILTPIATATQSAYPLSAKARETCMSATPGVGGAGSIRDFGKSWGPGAIVCPAQSKLDTTCTVISPDNTAAGCAKVGCRCIAGTFVSGGACPVSVLQ